METFNNVKGDFGIIRHEIGRWFPYTHKVQSIDDNKVVTDFDLSDYAVTFKIYDKEHGTELHECTVSVSGSVVSIAENIPITKSGTFYFEEVITNDTNPLMIYTTYYGPFEQCKMIKAFKILKLKDWRFKITQSAVEASLFDDWFLWSTGEAQAANDELNAYGLGNFNDEDYWTSTEVSSSQAYVFEFFDNNIEARNKNTEWLIRPIRSFTAAAGAYNLRDTGPAGGLIFIVDGTTYFECALEDLGPSEWSDIVDVAIGSTGTAIGTGYENTLDIINQGNGIGSMIIESTFIIA